MTTTIHTDGSISRGDSTPKASQPTEELTHILAELVMPVTSEEHHRIRFAEKKLEALIKSAQNQVLDMVKAEMPKHPDGTCRADWSNGFMYAIGDVTAAIEKVRGNK